MVRQTNSARDVAIKLYKCFAQINVSNLHMCLNKLDPYHVSEASLVQVVCLSLYCGRPTHHVPELRSIHVAITEFRKPWISVPFFR